MFQPKFCKALAKECAKAIFGPAEKRARFQKEVSRGEKINKYRRKMLEKLDGQRLGSERAKKVCYVVADGAGKWTYRDNYECMLATRKQKVQVISESSSEGGSSAFMAARRKEIQGLTERRTFVPLERKEGMDVLPLSWVLTVIANGAPKGRLVVKGFLDSHGFLVETYAPTASRHDFKQFLSLCVCFQWAPICVDLKRTFLQSDDLEKEVFVQPPPGWKGKKNMVWRLKKPLYGLKDAPRLWHKTLVRKLKEIDFERIRGDSCIWHHAEGGVCMVHVDDVVMAGTTEFRDKVRKKALEDCQKYLMSVLRKKMGTSH